MRIRSDIFTALALIGVFLNANAAVPTASQIRKEQEALREEYRQAELEYEGLVSEKDMSLPATEALVPLYEEFQKRASQLESVPVIPAPVAGPALIWAKSVRVVPHPVSSADAFLCAIDGSVVPFSGEFVRHAEDISLPKRGGIGFSFVRTYASFSSMDYGLGPGWDCNWNVTLRSEGENALVLHFQGRDIRFALQGGSWMPEPGEFLRLDLNGEKAVVTTPDLSRMEFETAAERDGNGRRWRLSYAASRHGNGSMNRLAVTYLDGCDRIHFVTDPFGQRIDFSYNEAGHLIQVTAPHDAVQFVYDEEGDTLVKAVYPQRMASIAMTAKSHTDYAYDGGHRLVRETPAGSPSLVATYDEAGRVVSCALEAKGQSQTWTVQYTDGETVVQGPAPTPENHYHFGNAMHSSLPDCVSIPARNAETRYGYNSDFLVTNETDAIGAQTTYLYDSDNPNPIHRGNRIAVRRTPVANLPADWMEIGTETIYHEEIAAIFKEVTYQVDKNGVRTNLKTESFEYSKGDLMPVRHDDGGIVSQAIFNRYGNPVVEVDAANHCTLYFYSDNLPVTSDYTLTQGRPDGGGLLVEQVEDAVIRAKPPRYGDAKVTPAVARRTRFARDVRGNVIREQCGYADTLYFRNSEGSVVAESDAQSGTRVHEYLPSGKTANIYTEFVPHPGAVFQGEKVYPFGDRRFVKETFEYDPLLQLSAHSPTAEASRDAIPRLAYGRYPNGRVHRFRNASGLCREDVVDPATGYLVEQRMVDNGNTAVLASNFQYHPNGELCSSVDMFGGKTEYRLDGFGNVQSTVLPNGRVDTRRVDALGRVLEEISEDGAGNILSRTTYSYDNPYGLLSREEAWTGTNSSEVVLEIVYDGNGRKIAERGAHEDSWSHTLYDGLGRIMAVRNPVGDYSVTIYRHDKEVYARTIAHGTSLPNITKTSGILSELDDYGRVARRVPVDAKGKVAKDREEFFGYDAVGKSVRTDNALVATETDYDSLGRTVRVRTTPKRTDQGERPVLVTTEYLADGRVVRRETGNTALALVGTKNHVTPQLVEAPQETKTEYDGLGRLIRTIQPDGLTVTTAYNVHSLPERMIWTHVNDSGKVLRSLSFTYSNMGQVLSISDALTGQVIQECEYDAFGRCIHSMDHGAGGVVEARMAFDTMGRVVEEGASLDGRRLPWQTFRYDAGKGVTERIWKGLAPPNTLHYWQGETYQADEAGRVRSLALDGNPFAAWDYVGDAVEIRAVRDSGLQTKWAYNDLGEPVAQRILRGNETFGTLEYAYGPQGQAEFSSTRLNGRLGREYTYAIYSGFDSYRRLTAQNGETAIPPGVAERSRRRSQVLGTKDDSLQALESTRMVYDQTDSLWVRYSGELNDSFLASAFSPAQTPVFVSAAKVQFQLRQPPSLELASNRETTTAFWEHGDDDVDRLKAEEDVYDSLGNLVEFNGTYWNGHRKYPVTWSLTYDPLGRLVGMAAKARENVFVVTNGEQIASLVFTYDSRNRRIAKTVKDCTDPDDRTKESVKTTYTVFSGNEQRLVLEDANEGDRNFKLREEYLWGAGSRELLMAAMPENLAEKEKAFGFSNRYYFQQDRNLNVILVTKKGTLGPETVSTASYLGFGENATRAKVESVKCDGDDRFGKESISQSLDGFSGKWYPLQKGLHYLQLDLEEESHLAQLNIWTADHFPGSFAVFVLPSKEKTPDEVGNLTDWVRTHQEEYCVAISDKGKCQGRFKRPEWELPYRINLGGLRGQHIAIVWDGRDSPQGGIEVREFEVTRVPDNPSAIAFAGQWLDRETDLYYQINRYRKAGSEKFISPDPLGFLDGPNMYAYAHANPLEWHDPDGRLAFLAPAGIGAAIGAILGGGGYALRCWLTGEEFSWKEFAIQTAIGAISGAIAGATFGACLPAAAGFWGMVGAGAASGAAGGFVQGTMDTGLHGGSFQAALLSGAKGAVVGGIAGAVGGGVVKGIAAPKNISFFGRQLSAGARGFLTAGVSGFSAGGVGGATSGLMTGLETGDYSGVGTGFVKGALVGAATGIAVHGALAGYERARGITWDQNRASYWKEEARLHPDKWSAENLARMQSGRAPQRFNPDTGMLESMELHHSGIPRRAGLSRLLTDQRRNLRQVWPDEHRAIDPFRR